MGADVADGGADARTRRIEAPLGLLLAELLVRHHQEILQVLDDDLAHRPHRAGAKEFARVADERVARVVVRHGEDEAGLLDQLHQLLGLGEAVGHRLVADDVKTGIEKSLGDREVGDVGRDDADEIDALVGRKLRFRRRHLLVGADSSAPDRGRAARRSALCCRMTARNSRRRARSADRASRRSDGRRR